MKWNELSMADRAKYIQLGVSNGITDLNVIREVYNKYAEGGPKKVGPHYNKEEGAWYNANNEKLRTNYGYWSPSAQVYTVYRANGKANRYTPEQYEQLPKRRQNVKPSRARNNSSSTASGSYNIGPDYPNTNSTKLGEEINNMLYMKMGGRYVKGNPNMQFATPYLPSRRVVINGVTASANALDTIAKYAGQAQIPIIEGLGLFHESFNGSAPLINTSGAWKNTSYGKQNPLTSEQKKVRDRVILNTNYFTNYGIIPTQYMFRDFEYQNMPENIPPALHAFDYFDRGLYNPGDPNHISNNRKYGEDLFNSKVGREWWKDTGRKEYEKGLKESNLEALKFLEGKYGSRASRRHKVKYSK